MTTATELLAYRKALIEDITGHSVSALGWTQDVPQWAMDRLNCIRDVEWDLAEMGIDGWEPFILAHYRITGTWK